MFFTAFAKTAGKKKTGKMHKPIIEYLKRTYSPDAIVVYGSFANHTNDEKSDFDALLIADVVKKEHDSSFFQNIQLDVHIFSTGDIETAKDLSRFVQIYDSVIILDKTGAAGRLKERVADFVRKTKVSADEKEQLKNWCVKMLKRAKRGDAEGMYRRHWLLCDSLEIYCKIRDRFYFGPKKTLEWIKKNDSESYKLASTALGGTCYLSLENWIRSVIEG